MIRENLTFDVVKSRFLRLLNEENTPRSHMIAAAFLIASQKGSDVSLRSILKLAGYATSKFYRFWPARTNFILDAYLFCVEKYIESEVTFAREFSGDTPRAYFELIGQHTMHSQKYVHRNFFREIAGQIAEGDYSRLLVHMDAQVQKNLDIFIEKFPQYQGSVDYQAGRSLIWAVGTFILTRNYDNGLETISEDKLVGLIADAYLGCIKQK